MKSSLGEFLNGLFYTSLLCGAIYIGSTKGKIENPLKLFYPMSVTKIDTLGATTYIENLPRLGIRNIYVDDGNDGSLDTYSSENTGGGNFSRSSIKINDKESKRAIGKDSYGYPLVFIERDNWLAEVRQKEFDELKEEYERSYKTYDDYGWPFSNRLPGSN